MYRRILVPTDGSPHAAAAARAAADLAKLSGGTVLVVTAVEYGVISEGLPKELSDMFRGQIDQFAKEVLEKTERAVRERGASVEAKLIEGSPANAILEECERTVCDLIVMGSRGVTTASGMREYIGSVALRVLARSLVPVLVIPPPLEDVD